MLERTPNTRLPSVEFRTAQQMPERTSNTRLLSVEFKTVAQHTPTPIRCWNVGLNKETQEADTDLLNQSTVSDPTAEFDS
jgi:hypothetical protein